MKDRYRFSKKEKEDICKVCSNQCSMYLNDGKPHFYVENPRKISIYDRTDLETLTYYCGNYKIDQQDLSSTPSNYTLNFA